jgi:hypothetical protein
MSTETIILTPEQKRVLLTVHDLQQRGGVRDASYIASELGWPLDRTVEILVQLSDLGLIAKQNANGPN